jgi:hypothetical protein
VAAPYVTAAAILEHAGRGSPTAEETAWAELVADALEAEIAHRLAGVTIDANLEAIVRRAAVQDGAAGFAERQAPHGVVNVDGVDVIRLGRDLVRALGPVFRRYNPGIA